jgi:hypothetical protein
MNSYHLFRQQITEAAITYPELKVSVRDGIELLSGTFRVIDDEGKEWNSFQIEIRFNPTFPYLFPELAEVGGKIPKISDWHINENGGCCITVPLLEVNSCKYGITVLQFIQNHVKPYLFNQAHRFEKGYYAHQEFAHGVYGILECYQELFNEKELEKVIGYLKTLKYIEFGKKNACFCGRKAKFRKCHPEVFRLFKYIPGNFIDDEIKRLVHLQQDQA